MKSGRLVAFCGMVLNLWPGLPLLCGFLTIFRCNQWVQNCRREDLRGKSAEYLYKNCVLCSLHFEECQFMNAQARNSLVWNAVPTKFPEIPNPPPQLASKRHQPTPRKSLTTTPSIKKCKLPRKAGSSRDSQDVDGMLLCISHMHLGFCLKHGGSYTNNVGINLKCGTFFC